MMAMKIGLKHGRWTDLQIVEMSKSRRVTLWDILATA